MTATPPNPLDFGACATCTEGGVVVWHSGPCRRGGMHVPYIDHADRPRRAMSTPTATAPPRDPSRVIRKVAQLYDIGTTTLGDIVRRDAGVGTPEWQAWAKGRLA